MIVSENSRLCSNVIFGTDDVLGRRKIFPGKNKWISAESLLLRSDERPMFKWFNGYRGSFDAQNEESCKRREKVFYVGR